MNSSLYLRKHFIQTQLHGYFNNFNPIFRITNPLTHSETSQDQNCRKEMDICKFLKLLSVIRLCSRVSPLLQRSKFVQFPLLHCLFSAFCNNFANTVMRHNSRLIHFATEILEHCRMVIYSCWYLIAVGTKFIPKCLLLDQIVLLYFTI